MAITYDALRAENEDLRRRLRDAGLLLPSIPLPDEAQTTRLLALVEVAHPTLAPSEDQRAWHRIHFRNALSYLSFSYRTSDFSKYSAMSFLDDCRTWIERYGLTGGCSLRAFCAACVASNIGTATFEEFPHSIDLCLSFGGTGDLRAGWKDTLTAGHVPAPVPRRRRAFPEPSPVIVSGGLL
jgi:hypothetical protein